MYYGPSESFMPHFKISLRGTKEMAIWLLPHWIDSIALRNEYTENKSIHFMEHLKFLAEALVRLTALV